jgi:flagellar biogenesis protein FliO
MPVHDWVQFAFSVTFVFLLLAACLWWLAKRKGGFLVNRENRPIQVVDTLQLGIKHKLMLVSVEGQKILVSITPNDLKTLHAWRDESAPVPQPVASRTVTQSFKDTLGDVNGAS